MNCLPRFIFSENCNNKKKNNCRVLQVLFDALRGKYDLIELKGY